MRLFNHTNRFKKLILIVVFMMLFSFCCPIKSNAIDLKGDLSDFFFWIERGILRTLNNIFCDERHTYEYEKTNDSEGNKLTVYISPETIIKGKFAILNANIFDNIKSPKQDSSDPAKDEYYDTDPTNNETQLIDFDAGTSKMVAGRIELRRTISGWYYAIRNLAIVALLSILVYVGIRMMLTSTSQDKAKYKTMLKDWLVSLCLLMVMHYIMVGVLNLSSMIVDAIGKEGHNSNSIARTMEIITQINESKNDDHAVYYDSEGNFTNEESNAADSSKPAYTIGDAYAYELVLLGIIGYTFIFAVKYLLRMMTIIFLILIAPVTSITYAIDKIGDGKAQAFNMWFQEFFYQVIIQPFHLLIYVVLIGSASELADTNVLYSIMCFAVMIPAERFIKQMFGFKDKLGSPLGAFATGALANKLLGGGSSSSSKSSSTSSSNSDNTKDPAPKTVDAPKANNEGEGADTSNSYQANIGAGNDDNSDNSSSENSINESEEENTLNSYEDANQLNEDDDQIDYERAEAFRNYRDSGLSQEEAEAKVNEELPFDRNDTIPEEIENSDTQATNNIDSNDEPKDDSSVIDNQNRTSETNQNNVNSQPSRKERFKASKAGQGVSALREKRDKALLKKYGTKNRAEVFGRYAGRKAWEGTKKGARGVIRGATTIGGALGGVLLGSMFGQAKAGMAAGAALGNKVGTKVGNGVTNGLEKGWEGLTRRGGVISTVRNARRDEEGKKEAEEKEAKRKFRSDPYQLKKASESFAKRNGSKIPNTKELNQELDDRFKFKQYGFDDNKIDTAMEMYSGYKEQGYSEEEAEYMTALAGTALPGYKAKDFRDEKAMKGAHEDINGKFIDGGFDEATADMMTRQIINDAATFAGSNVTAKLPPQTEEMQYLQDSQIRQQVRKEMTSDGKAPTEKQVTNEMKQRHELKKNYGMDEKQITETRKSEQNYIASKRKGAKSPEEVGNKVQEAGSVIGDARAISGKYSRKELTDPKTRTKIEKEHVKRIMEEKKLTKEAAEKKSKETFGFVDKYKGINTKNTKN